MAENNENCTTTEHENKAPVKQGHIVHDSGSVKDVQKWLGIKDDGMWGEGTSRAFKDKITSLVPGSNGEITPEVLGAMRNSPDEATKKAGEALEKLEHDHVLSRVYNPKTVDPEKCGVTENLANGTTSAPPAVPQERGEPHASATSPETAAHSKRQDWIDGGAQPSEVNPFNGVPPVFDGRPVHPKTLPYGVQPEGGVLEGITASGACPVVTGANERMDTETWNGLSAAQREAIDAAVACRKHMVGVIQGDAEAPTIQITGKNPAHLEADGGPRV